MARVSPIRDRHRARAAPLAPWGPPGVGVELVEAFDAPELEYAAIRKSAAMLDLPSRGLIELRGEDRLDFMGRMVTQDVASLADWSQRASFWLDRRGRIVADLRVLVLPGRVWMELDVHAVAPTIESLNSYLFTEDCELREIGEDHHRIALHGPGAPALLEAAEPIEGHPPGRLRVGEAGRARLHGVDLIAFRDDAVGGPSLELICPASEADRLWQSLLDTVLPRRPGSPPALRAVGWRAWNVARIEAGTPLFMLDFAPGSLPAETGLLDSRVSFTKGCFLGQEVVARMRSRRRAAKALVAIRFEPSGELQPSTGTPLVASPAPDSPTIGQITSSAVSPLLGSDPIAFAVVKASCAEPGTILYAAIEADRLPGRVQPGLRFIPSPGAPATP